MEGVETKSSFPIGAKLCRFLGFTGDAIPAMCQHEFEHILHTRLQEKSITDPELLVDIITEFVQMNLPLLALQLWARHEKICPADNFRAVFMLAAAQMLNGDMAGAAENFCRANKLAPDEIAVHINIVAILRETKNQHTIRPWLLSGLHLVPNKRELWLVASEIMTTMEIQELAQKLLSWSGASLAAQITGKLETALAVYQQVFACGERDEGFLIEFTATLGHLQKYEELVAVAWQLQNSGQLPWQVYSHFAQGFSQLQKEKQARRYEILAQRGRESYEKRCLK